MISVGSIVIRVTDLDRQTAFWERALGYERRVDRPDDFVLLAAADGSGPNIALDRVAADRSIPPRIHLDLYTDNQTGEIERLVELGAQEVVWEKRPHDADYVIMEDPEGNRFCVVDTAG